MKNVLLLFLASIVIGFLLASVFSGCSRNTYPAAGEVVHDTIHVTKTVHERDTSIIVPGAKVDTLLSGYAITPIRLEPVHSTEDVSSTPQTVVDKQNRQAHLMVQNTLQGLKVDCNCDTLSIEAKLRDSLTEVYKGKTTIKTNVIRERYTPKVVQILAWIGGAALLGGGGLLTRKLI